VSKVPKKSVSEEKANVAVPKMPRVTPAKAYVSVMVTFRGGHFFFSWAIGFTVKEKITLYFSYIKILLLVCNSLHFLHDISLFVSDLTFLSGMLLVRLFLLNN